MNVSLPWLSAGAVVLGGGLFQSTSGAALPHSLSQVNCTGQESEVRSCSSISQGTESCDAAVAVCQGM